MGPGDTSLGKDAVSVSEDWAAGWDSLEELDAEELDATILFVTQHLTFHMIIHATNDTNLLSGG